MSGSVQPKPRQRAPRQRYGSVEKATRSELRRLKCSVATEGLAALAVALARQIDGARGAVAAAAAAGQLRLILDDLQKAAAERRPEKDGIDKLRDRGAGAGRPGAAVVRGAPFGVVGGRKSG